MSDMRMDASRKINNSDSSNVALLSCELCSKRKIRCDKQQPCSACVKAGKECTPVVRARLPRGRRGGRKEANTELKARVRRLEDLIQSLSGNNASSPPSGPHESSSANPSRLKNETGEGEVDFSTDTPEKASPETPNNNDISRLLGSTVWMQLSSELNGLRSVLEKDDEDDEPEAKSPNNTSSRDENLSAADSPIGFGNQDTSSAAVLSGKSMKDVMSIYAYNIDPVMKLVHFPTLQQSLENTAVYMSYPPGSSSFEAVKSAVIYASISSLDEARCSSVLGEKKEILQGRWQASTEYWLRRADITINQNIVLLQALILYIAAVRSHDNGPRSWTLMGLAVRIAHGLQLHREDAYQTLSFFQAQMHRRAWFGLMGLDFQASFDRGTDPAVPASSYNTRFPLEINDADFGPSSPMTWSERQSPTEMTFMTIAAEGQCLIRQLSFIPAGESEQPPTPLQCSWEIRQQTVTEFVARITSKYLSKLDTSDPVQFASLYLGEVIISAMQLYIVRPLQRHPAASPPPLGAVNVLLRATETLERKHMFKNAVTAPWHWLFAGYVDWHPLATLLAELCSPQDDLQLVERAWRAADIAFEAVAEKIAEGTSGTLWKPLKKLMKMAQRRRALEQSQQQPAIQNTLPTTDNMMSYTTNTTGLDTSLRGLNDSLPQNFSFGLDPMDDSWMNWQGFVDDLAQNSFIGWTSNPMPFQPDASSTHWPVYQ